MHQKIPQDQTSTEAVVCVRPRRRLIDDREHRFVILAAPDNSDLPPFAPTVFQRTWAPPEEELLVDSSFDKGEGEAVGYDKVDEPVGLDAGDVGERW